VLRLCRAPCGRLSTTQLLHLRKHLGLFLFDVIFHVLRDREARVTFFVVHFHRLELFDGFANTFVRNFCLIELLDSVADGMAFCRRGQ
jgi:hypothetical protein